jgi:hypothetical protein
MIFDQRLISTNLKPKGPIWLILRHVIMPLIRVVLV